MADDITTDAQEQPPQTAAAEDVSGRHEACVAEAWRLLSEGVYTFRAIARGVNDKTGCSHDDKWVKRALVRHGALVAETIESGAIDARAKYLQALYTRRASAAAVAKDPKARPGERIAALKLMTEIDERVAAAEGVVTKRERQEQTGAGGGPLQVAATVDVQAVVSDEEATRLAVALTNRVGRSAADAGGAGDALHGAGRDALAAGAAPGGAECEPDGVGSGAADAADGDDAAAAREE